MGPTSVPITDQASCDGYIEQQKSFVTTEMGVYSQTVFKMFELSEWKLMYLHHSTHQTEEVHS